jgi:hypothetical protein
MKKLERQFTVHGLGIFLNWFEMKCPKCGQIQDIVVHNSRTMSYFVIGGFFIMIEGWYYLHKNGDLIFKHNLPGTVADIRESDFAVMLWPADTEDRKCAWRILVEALACGAHLDRVQELAAKWHCDDDDAQVYASRVGARLFKDGDQWCATRKDYSDSHESPRGLGNTALEALAELCKELGYKPQKMWGATFVTLLR